MIPPDWTPHRREDGELLGWIRPEGEDWVAVDVLGRPASGPMDWLQAEEALDARGLSWLAEIWMLERDGSDPLRVKLVEVTPGRIGEPGRVVVQTDDFGAIDKAARGDAEPAAGCPSQRPDLAQRRPPEGEAQSSSQ